MEEQSYVKVPGIVVKRSEFPHMEKEDLIEKMVKKFTKICNKDGILKKFINKQSYEKPSDKRRRKRKEYINNIRKNEKRGFGDV